MIIDGHAHVYNEKNAEKIVSAFTELHRMEPTASLGLSDSEKELILGGNSYRLYMAQP